MIGGAQGARREAWVESQAEMSNSESRMANRMFRSLRILWVTFGLIGLCAPPAPAQGRRAAQPPPAGVKESDAADKNKKAEKESRKKEPPDRYLVIRAGTLHTVTQGDLRGVSVLTKNGKIVEIAERVAAPPEAEVLDARRFHVYPGLVAATSGGLLGNEPPDDTTDVFSLPMTLALAGGITTAVTGNTAAKLSYGDIEGMIVRRELFKPLRYPTSDPGARRDLREKFERVRQYLRDLEAHEEKKKIDPKVEPPDKEWLKGEYETIYKLMRKEATAVMDASEAAQLRAAADLAARYGFSLVVRGAMEGWTVAPHMARAGLSAIITPRSSQWAKDRLNRPTGSSIENAAILHRHGVPFAVVPEVSAITLWGLAGRDLLHLNMEAAFAVRGGLSNEAALRAITIDAARILGIDHRVGSIEPGKDADFAITDGDILHYMTHVRWTIVNGRIAYDKEKDTLFDHIRRGGDLEGPPPVDHWPRTLGGGP